LQKNNLQKFRCAAKRRQYWTALLVVYMSSLTILTESIKSDRFCKNIPNFLHKFKQIKIGTMSLIFLIADTKKYAFQNKV